MSESATKQDLSNLEQRIDMKFEKLEGKMDRKFDEMDTKFNDAINKKFSEVIKHFDVVAENIHKDVAGANADEISLMKQKHDNIEVRVSALEDKVPI